MSVKIKVVGNHYAVLNENDELVGALYCDGGVFGWRFDPAYPPATGFTEAAVWNVTLRRAVEVAKEWEATRR